MASVRVANALVLLQLSSLLLCTITVYGDSHYPPAHAPAPPPHGHHHHHHHAPTPSPTHPPTPPPTPPPTHHHYPPPSHPHTPPPSHPPPPPPSHPHYPPPSHPTPPPPSHPHYPPPSHPPTPPPAKPPTPPPAKPPTPSYPPVKPPSYPPPRKLVAVQGVVYCKSCKYRGVDTLQGAAPLAGAVVKLQCNNTKYGLVEQTKTDKNGYFFFMPQKLTTSGSHKCKVFLISSPVANCSVPTNFHGGAVGAILMPPKAPIDNNPKFLLFTVGPFAFEPHKKLPCY
ncbi:hypothetical protein BUALT_Bualt03G0055900 [Buddleja alternifolia]|uniref:Uncharacterized protein n=1 Tax=Buddleja alternifolia TaxID=168488 RepID=A0AAV6XRC2_9LAMI|nr:hypothetical protein BUALT_Bualt03G0055900 [Buddleja alternifolia]